MISLKDEEAQESELAKEVVEIYEQFVGSKEYLQYIAEERDRLLINDRMKENYQAGINKGLAESKLNDMKIAIQQIYHHNDLEWLNHLSLKQLEEGFCLVFKGLDYEELKQKIIENNKITI